MCPKPSSCTHAVPHLPSFHCHPWLSLASKERGECVCRDLSTERERMAKFIRGTELKSLSPVSPLANHTQLPLLGTLPHPACHLAQLNCLSHLFLAFFISSLLPLLSLSVSIHLLLTLHSSLTHVLIPDSSPFPFFLFFLSLHSTLISFEFPSLLDLEARMGGWGKSREGWGSTIVAAVPWLFCCR